MNTNLIVKILSRLILLFLGWLLLGDFLAKGWNDASISETFHTVEIDQESSLGLYSFLALRALGIIVFGSFLFLYLVPSVLGFIYFLKISAQAKKIIFLILGLASLTFLVFFLIAKSPSHEEQDFFRLLIAGILAAVYVQGLVLVYRGKNLMFRDFE
ncbi:MAG: hypothetical protein JW801_11810 [Bacteroidales bacterium]|nr:hypothetical protein [Bacteroidales bacterium]